MGEAHLKEWVMIHKIKAGNGLTIRAIARQLGISRNTVRKYLRMDETAIAEQQESRVR
ncbi:helix-turn-helix domain-containing protein, partial [Thiolapillus sp.]|uniref:helix-turn-helix domain-containing protein n=1 Tax=Thiolapillus sp. TaxID=2017437 RepID=UPI003AF870E5